MLKDDSHAQDGAVFMCDSVDRLHASGLSLKKIALIFGINDKTVWAVISGKTWKHVK